MKIVSYGLASPPKLVINLLQNIEDNETQLFPLASQLTHKNLYSTNQTDAVN